MRDHLFMQHPSSTSLVDAFYTGSGRRPKGKHVAFTRDRKGLLKRIRGWGMWAFVIIPRSEAQECVIHYWFRRNKNPLHVAMMIGHELGHISGGVVHVFGVEEERRADGYGDVAEEVLAFLRDHGMVRLGRP